MDEAKTELIKFLDGEKPFIFTLNENDNISALNYTLDQIMETEVYYLVPLENLLYSYYESLYKKDFSMDAQEILANKNPWESYDIGCLFHKNLAASKFCSLAK
jgi:hypothetical protein